MPDHLHLFLSAKPYISPTEIVKTIKSITVMKIFKQFKDLKSKKFWGSGLWSKGYNVGTAGIVTYKTIQKYIDEQKLNYRRKDNSSSPTRDKVSLSKIL